MCRWIAYQGERVFLETVLTTTGHSLVHQSQSATEGKTVTNGDGFGVAWYDQHEDPGLFRDILPAWSNPNLKSLGKQVRGHTILAHVRAATGGGVNHENCHPFVCGNWSFMHNGQIGGFANIRRDFDMALPAALYMHRHGTTDSEALFLLALAAGLDADPKTALERAARLGEKLSRERGTTPHLRLSICCSDGQNVYAARYASDQFAPTLYFCQQQAGLIVASEPIDDQPDWRALPSSSFLRTENGEIIIEPFAPDLHYSAQILHSS